LLHICIFTLETSAPKQIHGVCKHTWDTALSDSDSDSDASCRAVDRAFYNQRGPKFEVEVWGLNLDKRDKK